MMDQPVSEPLHDVLASRDAKRPRKPVRSTGVARYEGLLDALEGLLADKEPEDVSLRELARVADAPVASVYHFFPSMSAALVGLAERHMQTFVDILAEPLDVDALVSWEDFVILVSERSRAYYNAHPVVLKLILGPEQSWSIRELDLQNNRRLARFFFEAARAHFELPESDSLLDRFEIAITMTDSIWALSYARHGTITDELAREAQRAALSYLRGYLPTYAEKRVDQ
jgi:AcrR family transcriptional regulator